MRESTVKKTEKIEIRVSPEEKEALADASRRQGRTASDVLREQVRGYIAAAAETGEKLEKKMSWISKAAYIALGAGISVPAVLFAASGDSPSAPGFEVRVSLEEPVGDQGRAQYLARTRIPLSRKEPMTMVMPSVDETGYQVSVETKSNSDKTYDFKFSICREQGDGCDVVSTPTLVTGFGGQSSLGVENAEGVEIHIVIESVEA